MTERIPPTPSVEHLTTMFRRVAKGDIRIPAFQRDLVWDESQIISLLESVYKGFPVGSLLLWNVRKQVLKDAVFKYPVFPKTEIDFPTNYVLDGMQRLSSLYGVFHFQPGLSDPRLNIWFNLRELRFQHEQTLEEFDRDNAIPVRSLINPRELFEIQSRFLGRAESDDLIDRIISIQSRFQDYMLPLVTITREEVSSVVEIFERINNSGTKLDTVDFMRAVTWSNDFDLNGRLDDIDATLSELSFSQPEQTLIKILGLELGRDPLPESLLTLREEGGQELNQAAERARVRLVEVARFFRDELNIRSSTFVPYEGQILVIYKALMPESGLTGAEREQLKKWYWAVGFNEALRGKPDHYVARAVRSIRDLLEGRVRGVEPRLELRRVDFIERRFVQRGALSASLAGLFALNKPRSLRSGETIDPDEFIAEFSASNFLPILSAEQLEPAVRQKLSSPKLLANIYVAGATERSLRIPSMDEVLTAGAVDPSILRSQFLSHSAVEHLRNGEHRAFLEERAEIMLQAARAMVSSPEPRH